MLISHNSYHQKGIGLLLVAYLNIITNKTDFFRLNPPNRWLSLPTILPYIPSIRYGTSSRLLQSLKISILSTHDSLGEYIYYFWRILFEEFFSLFPFEELNLKEHSNLSSRLSNLKRMLYKFLSLRIWRIGYNISIPFFIREKILNDPISSIYYI